MAGNIAKDPAVLSLLVKPIRSGGGAQPMGAKARHLNDVANFPLGNHLSRQHGPFIMQPLGIIDHVFPSGLFHGRPGPFQLLQGGKGALIGKVILPRCHHPDAQISALAGNGRRRNHMHPGIGKQFLLGRNRHRLGKLLQKCRTFLFIRLIYAFQLRPRLNQRAAHAVDMRMLQAGYGKHKFSRLDHRLIDAHRITSAYPLYYSTAADGWKGMTAENTGKKQNPPPVLRIPCKNIKQDGAATRCPALILLYKCRRKRLYTPSSRQAPATAMSRL